MQQRYYITNIIDRMKAEEKKTENLSDSYGIAVDLGEDALYGSEYFAQDEVDKLNSIIEISSSIPKKTQASCLTNRKII